MGADDQLWKCTGKDNQIWYKYENRNTSLADRTRSR